MLYLIATPIGHLSDFSFRAVETCKLCDYLLCEDTRRSQILLGHYQIKKPLKSYHLFNEAQKLEEILSDLDKGLSIGLLSDGGTPLICDPGALLVRTCIERNLQVSAIPGPSALIEALILSGFDSHPFQFLGFMPRKEKEILQILSSALFYPGTTLFYESPQRLADTLKILSDLFPQTRVAIARELTKTYEEVFRSNASEAYAHFLNHPPKGEIVLLIEGKKQVDIEQDPKLLVEELIKDYKLSLTEAIKTASHLLKTQKQSIYRLFHSEK